MSFEDQTTFAPQHEVPTGEDAAAPIVDEQIAPAGEVHIAPIILAQSVLTDSQPILAGGHEPLAPTEDQDFGASDQELRARLTAQFEQWLDKMLAGEAPPAGIPAELLEEIQQTTPTEPDAATLQADLYTLFAGLTTLTGEVRLQGRAFRQLSDTLAPVAQAPARLAQIEESQSHTIDLIEQALADKSGDELPVSAGEACGVIVDLYDRLERGLRTCDNAIQSLADQKLRGGLRAWLGGSAVNDQAIAAAHAIRDASALTLARVETVLQEWGIERIGRVGQPFDAQQMTAMDVRPSAEVPAGTVLEVNRSGYALNGQLKAAAQVTVARKL